MPRAPKPIASISSRQSMKSRSGTHSKPKQKEKLKPPFSEAPKSTSASSSSSSSSSPNSAPPRSASLAAARKRVGLDMSVGVRRSSASRSSQRKNTKEPSKTKPSYPASTLNAEDASAGDRPRTPHQNLTRFIRGKWGVGELVSPRKSSSAGDFSLSLTPRPLTVRGSKHGPGARGAAAAKLEAALASPSPSSSDSEDSGFRRSSLGPDLADVMYSEQDQEETSPKQEGPGGSNVLVIEQKNSDEVSGSEPIAEQELMTMKMLEKKRGKSAEEAAPGIEEMNMDSSDDYEAAVKYNRASYSSTQPLPSSSSSSMALSTASAPKAFSALRPTTGISRSAVTENVKLSLEMIQDAGHETDAGRVFTLELARRGLTSVGKALLKCIKVRALDLSFNKLTKLGKSLATLPSLKELNLTSNRIEHLTPPFPASCPLRSLNLAGNELAVLEQGVVGLTQLKVLSLRRNRLQGALPDRCLPNCLTTLDLSYNKLNSVKNLKSCIALKELNVAYNNLTDVRGIVSCKDLEELDLSGNGIQKSSKLSKLTNLETLAISNNNIKGLSFISFSPSLTELNISSNLLQDLNGLEQQLPSLVLLDVSNNRLQNLQHVLLVCTELPSLAELAISGNPFSESVVLRQVANVLPSLCFLDGQSLGEFHSAARQLEQEGSPSSSFGTPSKSAGASPPDMNSTPSPTRRSPAASLSRPGTASAAAAAARNKLKSSTGGVPSDSEGKTPIPLLRPPTSRSSRPGTSSGGVTTTLDLHRNSVLAMTAKRVHESLEETKQGLQKRKRTVDGILAKCRDALAQMGSVKAKKKENNKHRISSDSTASQHHTASGVVINNLALSAIPAPSQSVGSSDRSSRPGSARSLGSARMRLEAAKGFASTAYTPRTGDRASTGSARTSKSRASSKGSARDGLPQLPKGGSTGALRGKTRSGNKVPNHKRSTTKKTKFGSKKERKKKEKNVDSSEEGKKTSSLASLSAAPQLAAAQEVRLFTKEERSRQEGGGNELLEDRRAQITSSTKSEVTAPGVRTHQVADDELLAAHQISEEELESLQQTLRFIRENPAEAKLLAEVGRRTFRAKSPNQAEKAEAGGITSEPEKTFAGARGAEGAHVIPSQMQSREASGLEEDDEELLRNNEDLVEESDDEEMLAAEVAVASSLSASSSNPLSISSSASLTELLAENLKKKLIRSRPPSARGTNTGSMSALGVLPSSHPSTSSSSSLSPRMKVGLVATGAQAMRPGMSARPMSFRLPGQCRETPASLAPKNSTEGKENMNSSDSREVVQQTRISSKKKNAWIESEAQASGNLPTSAKSVRASSFIPPSKAKRIDSRKVAVRFDSQTNSLLWTPRSTKVERAASQRFRSGARRGKGSSASPAPKSKKTKPSSGKMTPQSKRRPGTAARRPDTSSGLLTPRYGAENSSAQRGSARGRIETNKDGPHISVSTRFGGNLNSRIKRSRGVAVGR